MEISREGLRFKTLPGGVPILETSKFKLIDRRIVGAEPGRREGKLAAAGWKQASQMGSRSKRRYCVGSWQRGRVGLD